MTAMQRHLNEISRVEKEIKRTTSWKRKNDLQKYLGRLKKELKEYIYHRKL